MYRKKLLCSAMSVALMSPAALPALDFSGYLKNETAVFTRSGQPTGSAMSMLDTANAHAQGDLLKFENSARLFINGDVGESSWWHADLNFIYNSEGISSDAFDYRGHESYSQQDWLRELYLETQWGDWNLKLGKQQLVWGTADGIKLLDVINPTDFRELNQNTMEDARIPIWMAKVERELEGNRGNLQWVLSQTQGNRIPGLNASGDAGHPFLMKGVDAITGRVNGFLHITPALARTAQSFHNAARGGAFTGGDANPAGLLPFAGLTVDGFASGFWDNQSQPGQILPADPATGAPGFMLLNGIAQCGLDPACAEDPNANTFVTNLMPVTGPSPMDTAWAPQARTSAFEHMPNATFATFSTFAGAGTAFTGGSATAAYRHDHPGAAEPNVGMRFKNTTSRGLGYSLNYLYSYDPNPSIDLSWHDRVTGEQLQVQRAASMLAPQQPPDAAQPVLVPNLASDRTRAEIQRNLSGPSMGDTTSILLRNAAGQYYGAVDPTFGMMPGAYSTNPVELRFTERLNRSQFLGSGLDYAVDTQVLGPVVLRGEFLYQRDARQPVVDNLLLGIGDLANGLTMEKADYFKYVLGADITVLTNLMISGQFIQYRNLDYVNERETCTTQTGIVFDCSRYTADFATMNPTNGLRQAERNKEFYSLFFSKPFGPSQRGRWNNITIYEEGGGWWNRFDLDWSLTDRWLVLGEWNHYWGDDNTTFGQFADSSSLQVGLKFLFD
jgi:hypothetical protein